MVPKQVKKETTAEAVRYLMPNQCPHLRLWPVPSCHAKNGRIHIQADQTVENYCTKGAHVDCILFLQRMKIGTTP